MSATARNVVDADWQSKSGPELASTLASVFTVVREENAWRTDKDEFHWGLYEGTGLGGVTLKSRRNMLYENATLPDNVCKMSVDTLTAKVATIRPIPQVQTSQGNFKDKRRAKKLRQLIQGQFHQSLVHENLAPRIIKDSLVCRAGVVHVGEEGKRVKIDRIYSWELFVDDWDAEYGEPMTMMRLRSMDRRRAIARFAPKNKALADTIRNAGRLDSRTARHRDEEQRSTVDRVELLEAWYRCPDHDDEDEDHVCTGKHVLICDGAALLEEDWIYDRFPFAILTYDTPNTGFWGSGVVQTLEGYQSSIDESNERTNAAITNSSKGVILRDGGGVFKSDVVDGLRILNCRSGFEPIVFDFDLVNEHMRMRAPELIERALNAVGVSQLAAQSKKPEGVEAGIALQTLDDIESQRHIVFGRRFESWCMTVARLIIDSIKRIAAKHGDYAVKVPLRGEYLELKWKDVHVDGFQLTMQSVGQLFTSFAGRLDKLKTLYDMGAIDSGTFMRELDAGDVQSELDLETIDRVRADEMIEAMLDSDEAANDNDKAIDPNYRAPDSYLPLEWTHRRAIQRRNMAQTEGAPVYVLGLMTQFADEVQYLIDKAAGKVPGAAPPLPGQPPLGAPPGGLPPDPMAAPPADPMMMPQGMSPAGDQLMTGPNGEMPSIAA